MTEEKKVKPADRSGRCRNCRGTGALDCPHCTDGVVWLGDDDDGGLGECLKCHGEGYIICSECGGTGG